MTIMHNNLIEIVKRFLICISLECVGINNFGVGIAGWGGGEGGVVVNVIPTHRSFHDFRWLFFRALHCIVLRLLTLLAHSSTFNFLRPRDKRQAPCPAVRSDLKSSNDIIEFPIVLSSRTLNIHPLKIHHPLQQRLSLCMTQDNK